MSADNNLLQPGKNGKSKQFAQQKNTFFTKRRRKKPQRGNEFNYISTQAPYWLFWMTAA